MSIQTFAADDAKLTAGKHFFLPCNEGSGDVLTEKASGEKYTVAGLAWNGVIPSYAGATTGLVGASGGVALPDLNTVDFVILSAVNTASLTPGLFKNAGAEVHCGAGASFSNDAGSIVLSKVDFAGLNVRYKVAIVCASGAVTAYTAAQGTAVSSFVTGTLSSAANFAVPKLSVDTSVVEIFGSAVLTYPKGSLPANASSLADAVLENWIAGNRVIPSALVNV